MKRPLLLDLFCGAGGASMGYYHAGFKVVGVDIKPQPRYPFTFVQADAFDFLDVYGSSFDAVHASPPCQHYTKTAKQKRTANKHPRLISFSRHALVRTDRPWVIENVMEAHVDLHSPIMLCATQFGLGVFRHRLFETCWQIPAINHERHTGRIGDGRFVTVTGKTGGRSIRDGIQHGCKADWQRAMNIDWMTVTEMSQAIPPAYTAYVGRFLRDIVKCNNGESTE